MKESIIVLSPVVIAAIIVMTITLLFDMPATALFMAYILGYMFITLFMYLLYKKSKEEEGERRHE